MTAKVSVIVPVYNEEKRVGRCINSILAQSYSNIELILVDDGSTDESGMICDAYAKEDQRIKVIHKENQGRVIARNTGLQASIGEWVAYVDSDDWVESDMISSMLKLQEQHRVDVVIAPQMVRDEAQCHDYEEKLEGVWEGEKLLDIYWQIAPSMCSKLFRKCILEKSQLEVDPSITFGEDMLCVRLCMLNTQRVYIMNRIFYHYTRNHGQRRYDPMYIENIFLLGMILRKHIQRLEAGKQRENLEMGVDRFIITNITEFGFGTVFGKANPASYRMKLEKVKNISYNADLSLVGFDETVCRELTGKEVRWWKLFLNHKIAQLYLEVRGVRLFSKFKSR